MIPLTKDSEFIQGIKIGQWESEVNELVIRSKRIGNLIIVN